MTNGDKIRSMNDKELADFLFSYVEPCFLCAYKEQGTCSPVDEDCSDGRLMWLKKEAEE